MSNLTSSTGGDPQRRLERREADAARLPASDAPRAAAIPEARLQEIVEELADCAAGIFPGHAIAADVFPEWDPETVARHRIELWVGGAEVEPLARDLRIAARFAVGGDRSAHAEVTRLPRESSDPAVQAAGGSRDALRSVRNSADCDVGARSFAGGLFDAGARRWRSPRPA
jgi:hypothetical protein